MGVGCGGSGVRNPIDSVYSLEVGGDSSGEYNQKVFVPTPHGIVHSNGCTAISHSVDESRNTGID